jgi:phosphate starvation-inducible protein PhoH
MAKQQSLAAQSSKTKSVKITRDPKGSYQKESEQEEKKRRRLASKAEREATKSELSRTIPQDQLSPDQRRVIEAVLAGKNVFFTGSAGTGKSV